MLTDVEIPAERLLDEQAPLSKQDLAACRASLGALQWLAVQTQPLLCGRCNILLSEFIKKKRHNGTCHGDSEDDWRSAAISK